MTWTSQTPTAPGWYWLRRVAAGIRPYPRVVEVDYLDDDLVVNEEWGPTPLAEYPPPQWEWSAAPIPEPVEAAPCAAG